MDIISLYALLQGDGLGFGNGYGTGGRGVGIGSSSKIHHNVMNSQSTAIAEKQNQIKKSTNDYMFLYPFYTAYFYLYLFFYSWKICNVLVSIEHKNAHLCQTK